MRFVSVLFAMFLPLLISANPYLNTSLLCSTESFPIKGGFKFINPIEVNKFNILVNSDGDKFLKSTNHCYEVLDEKIVISDKSNASGCGKYASYIDRSNLIYNIPANGIILSANCRIYNDDLLLKLEESIRN